MRIGYADQNGHPYRSLGRYLIERGEMQLEQASMQGIKAWAAANPQKLQDALNANPSYVFFRELPVSDDGPVGALGVPLAAGYSLAVDRRFVPLGAPVYLATTYPLSEVPPRAPDGGARHRRRDPRRGARRLLLGNRRRRPARRPGACASRAACGCCGRAASRCRGRTSATSPAALARSVEHRCRSASCMPPATRSPLARISVGVLLTPSLRPSSRFFSTGLSQSARRGGQLVLRCASSSQALARSGGAPHRREWSAFCGRITGYMKT